MVCYFSPGENLPCSDKSERQGCTEQRAMPIENAMFFGKWQAPDKSTNTNDIAKEAEPELKASFTKEGIECLNAFTDLRGAGKWGIIRTLDKKEREVTIICQSTLQLMALSVRASRPFRMP